MNSYKLHKNGIGCNMTYKNKYTSSQSRGKKNFYCSPKKTKAEKDKRGRQQKRNKKITKKLRQTRNSITYFLKYELDEHNMDYHYGKMTNNSNQQQPTIVQHNMKSIMIDYNYNRYKNRNNKLFKLINKNSYSNIDKMETKKHKIKKQIKHVMKTKQFKLNPNIIDQQLQNLQTLEKKKYEIVCKMERIREDHFYRAMRKYKKEAILQQIHHNNQSNITVRKKIFRLHNYRDRKLVYKQRIEIRNRLRSLMPKFRELKTSIKAYKIVNLYCINTNNLIDRNVMDIILMYFIVIRSNGYIHYTHKIFVKCCNNESCDNMISFNNNDELRRTNNDIIYKYYVKSYIDTGYTVQVVHKQRLRIFCKDCTENILEPCQAHQSCTNQDCFEICANHLICKTCNEYTSYAVKQCTICQEYCCEKCMVIDSLCKECIIRKEYEDTLSLISNIIYKAMNMWSMDIFSTVTHYLVGVTTQCMECDESIIINNKYDFFHKENDTYHYSVQKPYVNQNCIFIYGEYRRIFCAIFDWLVKCDLCDNYDMRPHCIKEDWLQQVDYVCCNHERCTICYDSNKLKKCIQCEKLYCTGQCILTDEDSQSKDRYKCRECIVDSEYHFMKEILTVSLKAFITNSEIIHILSEYCIGYIINCNNESCKKEIVINNQLDFYNSVNLKNIRQYSVDNQLLKYCEENQFVSVYGKCRRIFCYECRWRYIYKPKTGNDRKKRRKKWLLTKCIYYGCNNYEMNEICKNHPKFRLKCKYCDSEINNSSKCETCINTEYNEIQKILKLSIGNIIIYDTIIDILTYYSTGYSFNCCNCENEIVFNSKYEFKCDKKLHQYIIQKNNIIQTETDENVIFIDGEYKRIFCYSCHNKKNTKLIYCKKKCGNYDTTNICRNHSIKNINKNQQFKQIHKKLKLSDIKRRLNL